VIRIVEANFITSATGINDSLPDDTSEIVFLGRSNVGKSSFINALCNKKGLAKSSSTPGKTRLINFFSVVFLKENKKFIARFVDLPGFGYAKVSKSMKNEWQKNITNFLEKRSSIRIFIQLLDARHPRQQIDSSVHELLKSIKRGDQEIIRIFTKADKLNQKEMFALKKDFPTAVMVSNSKKTQIKSALELIFNSLFTKK